MGHPQERPYLWRDEGVYIQQREDSLDRECPYCGQNDSINVDPPIQTETWLITVPVDCGVCDASWNEAYYINGYDIFEKHNE